MGKADKMVERNKKVSREKAESVCKEIERMLADKERISPQELVRRTGVSRGFLYKNPVVSERMRQARIRQMDGQFIPVQKTILDSAMERTLELQKEQLKKNTIVILVFIIIVGIFLFAFDMLFAWLSSLLTNIV